MHRKAISKLEAPAVNYSLLSWRNQQFWTWFLDQDMPSHLKGGYVGILEKLLLWEDCLHKTTIRTVDSAQRASPHAWNYTEGEQIASSSWIFYDGDGCTENKVIQEEFKRTEKNEEAGYRSPTWSILVWLRALQKIKKSKNRWRSGGDVSPSLLSVGRTRRSKVLGRELQTYRSSMWKLMESEQDQWLVSINVYIYVRTHMYIYI